MNQKEQKLADALLDLALTVLDGTAVDVGLNVAGSAILRYKDLTEAANTRISADGWASMPRTTLCASGDTDPPVSEVGVEQTPADPQPDKQKRVRRTAAQIAADKAAEEAHKKTLESGSQPEGIIQLGAKNLKPGEFNPETDESVTIKFEREPVPPTVTFTDETKVTLVEQAVNEPELPGVKITVDDIRQLFRIRSGTPSKNEEQQFEDYVLRHGTPTPEDGKRIKEGLAALLAEVGAVNVGKIPEDKLAYVHAKLQTV